LDSVPGTIRLSQLNKRFLEERIAFCGSFFIANWAHAVPRKIKALQGIPNGPGTWRAHGNDVSLLLDHRQNGSIACLVHIEKSAFGLRERMCFDHRANALKDRKRHRLLAVLRVAAVPTSTEKPAKDKRATLPGEAAFTKAFIKDWEKLSRSGHYDMRQLEEAMMLLIANDASLGPE
jgi:hypothetical protein